MAPSRAGTVTLGAMSLRRIGLGTMKLTGPGTWGAHRDPRAARALLRRARDLGVDFFDTADAYGPAVSEELLREALHPFETIVLATKGGHTRQGPGRWKRNGRPEHLREACHASLRRLGIECIDLYQLHAVDPEVPIEESLGALAELQREGKIRHLGVCNVTLPELERARAVATIVSAQNRYSALDRTSDPVLQVCERFGMVFIPWAPLGGGRLPAAAGEVARIARRLGATRAQVVARMAPVPLAVGSSDSRYGLDRAPRGEPRRLGDHPRARRPRCARTSGHARTEPAAAGPQSSQARPPVSATPRLTDHSFRCRLSAAYPGLSSCGFSLATSGTRGSAEILRATQISSLGQRRAHVRGANSLRGLAWPCGRSSIRFSTANP